MFIKHLDECEPFIAGDKTLLREIFHPDKQDLALGYSLAHAVVAPDTASVPHRLKTAEVYYILEGSGEMIIDDEARAVSAGQAIYIPPRAVQHIRNTGAGDLKFLCIVDPAWREEDEEVL